MQHLGQLGDHPVNQFDVTLPQMAQPVQHALARVGAQLGECQVLEFRLERLHADPLGQGRVDLHGLGGDPPALFRALDEMQGAHVVEPVGKLDQQHADVLGHCEQKLAEILRLSRVGGLKLEPV